MLATLAPAQWDTPSLCTGWTVRDVVNHMMAAVVNGTIHHQDTVDLAFKARPIHAAKRAQGFGLVASDVDWMHVATPAQRI